MTFFGKPTPRPTPPSLQLGDRTLAFGGRFYVMGVLNITPDSFSDGGQFLEPQDALERALEMADAGADIIDIGGESTRPGADPVDLAEELERVVPIIEALSAQTDIAISVDTYKSAVARAAVEAGAHIVNDISGLGFDDQMAEVVADTGCALVLMHVRGTPRTMHSDVDYEDLVGDIHDYFSRRLEVAYRAGVADNQIVLDPGVGFGKTQTHNLRLLRDLHQFFDLDCPLLVGTSRKSFIGNILDKPEDQRVWGTAATVACSLYAGADIVRVHDVAEMADVVRVTEAICAMNQT
ncbi:MAG: dihydropteroate synthase [Persicimonas sp.]